MSSLLLTLAIAFLIVLICIGLLAIGWLISGKTRLRPGACGRDPHKNRNECESSANCQLCEHQKPATKKDNDKLS